MKEQCNRIYLNDENQKALTDFLRARACNLNFEVIFEIEGKPVYFNCEDCKYMNYKKFNEMFKALQDIKVLNSRARRYEGRLQPKFKDRKHSSLDLDL